MRVINRRSCLSTTVLEDRRMGQLWITPQSNKSLSVGEQDLSNALWTQSGDVGFVLRALHNDFMCTCTAQRLIERVGGYNDRIIWTERRILVWQNTQFPTRSIGRRVFRSKRHHFGGCRGFSTFCERIIHRTDEIRQVRDFDRTRGSFWSHDDPPLNNRILAKF